jgi:type IV pilus assembly protein PilA
MIVVAIIAILAAIALPAYQDYLVKSRVSEVMLAASAARTTVSEAAAADTGTTMPATAAIDTQASKYVSSVTYANGTITANGRALGVTTPTGTITLVGTTAANGQVDWVCGGTIAAKYRPATCQAAAAAL